MGYNPKDFYFKKAKERHFAARSVFKLEEIDQRFKIIRPAYKILDLGAAPGSWTQYAAQKVGPKGICLGIDLQKIQLVIENARFLQGDAFDEETVKGFAEENGVGAFDVVMSDMAPKTTGIRVQDQQRSFDLCQRALEVAKARLRPGGNFVVKLFQSESYDEFMSMVKPLFKKTEVLRPKSTRKASYEIYIIGIGKI
jgi:23S rRNA (uridine2552-2'-O)-methyltransferase